jgi:hypothetical protein
MEPQCEKIERQLSNGETSTWGISSSSISILGQDEEGTTVVMPCDGIAVMKLVMNTKLMVHINYLVVL